MILTAAFAKILPSRAPTSALAKRTYRSARHRLLTNDPVM
jgi:hypothetical protein